jgi:alkylation response protein AidB-like acyl-CoA dehydrogenase
MDAVRAWLADPSRFNQDSWKHGVWEPAAALGWTSLLVPEKLGGGCLSGTGVRDLAIIAEEAGQALFAGPLLPTNIVAFALAREPAGPLAQAHLPRIAAGLELAAWVSQPDAVKSGVGADGYQLTGTAGPVQDAQVADYLLVTADGQQFLVPADAGGLTVEPLDGLDRSRRYGRVRLNRVQVPGSAALVNTRLDGQLALALALQCAETAGALRAAYEMTLRYVKERKAFGRPIGSYQALKHRLAEMLLWLESAQAVTSAAVAAVESDHDALAMARTAKAYVADRGPALVRDCLQMHGGIGYTWEHDMHLFLRRVEASAEIYGGVAQQLGALAPVIGF